MSLEPEVKDSNLKDIEIEAVSAFDDFLKELEEAEKNLHITATDMVVEVEDSFDDSQAVASTPIPQPANDDFMLDSFETFAPEPPPLNPLPSASAAASSVEMNELKMKVATLEEERGELRQAMLRRQTDFDNFRKRTERERSDTFENILAKLSSKMLPVLDNLSRALDSSKQVQLGREQEFDRFIEGILLVNQQLSDVLMEMGVQPIASVGHPFDPHFHEAVATVENNELAQNTVVEEMLAGYSIGKKVIRPAMVKVSVTFNPQIKPDVKHIEDSQ